MKKGNSKALALLVIAVVLLTMFAGCGASNSGNEGSSQQTAASSEAAASTAATTGGDKYAPDPTKTYEISYLIMGNAQTDANAEILQKYNATFNVKIIPEFIEPASWDDLLNIKLASGQIPDVFAAKLPKTLLYYANQGLIAEIPKDALKTYAPDVMEMIDTNAPKAWIGCTIEGKNYGIPYVVSAYAIRHPLVWRTDWLNNVGITKTPDTLQEFEDAFTKFANEDPDKNGKKDTYGLSITTFESVFGAFGVIMDQWWTSYFLEKDNKIVFSAIEPGAKEALTLISKWYKAGLIDPEFITGENKGGYWAVSSDFVNGRIGSSGMGYYYHWGLPGAGLKDGADYTELKKINENATYAFGLPPLGPDGVTRGTGQDPVAGSTFYVLSSALEKDPGKMGKILQMFNWPQSDVDNWIYNAYGNEGKQFYIEPFNNGELKLYKLSADYSDPATVSKEGWQQFFYEAGLNEVKTVNGPLMAQAEKDHMFEYGVVDCYYSLVMPSYGNYINDLNKLMTDSYIKIITGEQPISYFDTFVTNWKSNGGDIILKEANDFYAQSKK